MGGKIVGIGDCYISVLCENGSIANYLKWRFADDIRIGDLVRHAREGEDVGRGKFLVCEKCQSVNWQECGF
jgi:hypothetical protein